MARSKDQATKTIALVLGTVTACGLVLELGARLTVGKLVPRSEAGILRPSALFSYPLHEWTPGRTGLFQGIRTRVNSAGFLGPEREPGKFKGERIAVIGDSIAAGWHVEMDETFAVYLEQMLNALGDHRVEVLNFAVPGYDTLESVTRLSALGRFRPDRVVYAFCINDLTIARPAPEIIEQTIYAEQHILWRSALYRFLVKKTLRTPPRPESKYADFVGHRVISIRGDAELERLRSRLSALRREGKIGPTWSPFFRSFVSPLHLGHFEYALNELAERAGEDGFEAFLLYIPPLLEFDDTEAAQAAKSIVRHEAEKYGLRFVDSERALREAGLEAVRLAGDSIHPGPGGHRIIAQVLAQVLSK